MLRVDIVSPDGSVFRGLASSVTVPGQHGSFQILSNHAPLIATLDVGKIVLRDESGEQHVFAISGGVVEVLKNTVIILAETAESAASIDVSRAQNAVSKASEALSAVSGEEREIVQRRLSRARNRLRVAMAR